MSGKNKSVSAPAITNDFEEDIKTYSATEALVFQACLQGNVMKTIDEWIKKKKTDNLYAITIFITVEASVMEIYYDQEHKMRIGIPWSPTLLQKFHKEKLNNGLLKYCESAFSKFQVEKSCGGVLISWY